MYGDDLSQIHHVGFGDLARGVAPGLLALLGKAGADHVLDLGCGSGIWLKRLARAGYRVSGIDQSRAMIRLARAAVPRARLTVGSIYDTRLPECDAMTALGEVLSYCPARGAHPSLARFFRKAARALPPGGLFVFDLMMTSRGTRFEYRRWRAEKSWAIMIETFEDRKRDLYIRDMTTFRKRGAAYHRDHERHVQQCYVRADVLRWLAAAGFSARATRRFGDYRLLKRRLGFIARKK